MKQASHARTDLDRGGLVAAIAVGLVLLTGLGGAVGVAQSAPDEAVVFSAATRCLNVREGPDQSARALQCLPPRCRMILVESGSGWGRVRLADGTEGWVALRLVTRDEAPPQGSAEPESQGATSPPSSAVAADRPALLRRLGQLEARVEELQRDLAAERAESVRLRQGAEAGRELFADRLAESDRLLEVSAALRRSLEQEKAELIESAKASEAATAAALAQLEAASAAREREHEEALQAMEARGRELEEALAAAQVQGRELEAENASLAARAGELESAVSAAWAEAETLAAARAEADARAAERAQAAAASAEREQELEEALEATQAQRQSVEQQMASLATGVAELESVASAAQSAAEAEAAARAAAEAQAVRQAEAAAALAAREGGLAEALKAAEARQGSLEEENAALAARVADLESGSAERLQQLEESLAAAVAQSEGLGRENAELAALVGELEKGHAEAVAGMESRLRAAEGFLAASEAERRELSERLAQAEASSGSGAAPATPGVKPLLVSIPPEGGDAPREPATEPPAAPSSGAAGTGPDDALRGELVAMVEAWAAAWSERRVDDYLSFYASDFRPPAGTSRAEWERVRRERVGRPEAVAVNVALMDVRIDGAAGAEVDVIQSYDSPAYSDTVLKTLSLRREEDRWRIVRETATRE